jgi:hypothetical protein
MIQHNKKTKTWKERVTIVGKPCMKKRKRKYLKKMLEKTWDFLLAGY